LRRQITVLAGLAIAAVVAAGAATPAHAGVSTRQTPAATKTARLASIRQAIMDMLQQRLAAAEMDRRLVRRYGLEVKGHHPDAVRPATAQGDVNLPSPWFVHDPDTDEWWVVGSWNWTSGTAAIADDCPWFGCPEDNFSVGGFDGYGIAFSRPIQSWNGYSLTTWGETDYYPHRDNRLSPETVDNLGVVFTGQDKINSTNLKCTTDRDVPPGHTCLGGVAEPPIDVWDYSFYNGGLVYDIGNTGAIGCGRIQATAKYVHTADGATITGVSLGVGPEGGSVGIQWQPADKGWPQGSYATPNDYVTPC
jgi:hypothetical protein